MALGARHVSCMTAMAVAVAATVALFVTGCEDGGGVPVSSLTWRNIGQMPEVHITVLRGHLNNPLQEQEYNARGDAIYAFAQGINAKIGVINANGKAGKDTAPGLEELSGLVQQYWVQVRAMDAYMRGIWGNSSFTFPGSYKSIDDYMNGYFCAWLQAEFGIVVRYAYGSEPPFSALGQISTWQP